MRLSIVAGWIGCLSVCALGCGDSSGGPTTTDDNCLDSLNAVANTEYCQDTPAQTDCSLVTGSFQHQACGVPLKSAPGPLERSENVDEFAGSGPPALDCFVPATYPASVGPSEPVTVKGLVKIFSSGCESNNVEIEAYEVLRGGAPEDEGKLGNLIGDGIVTSDDCEADGVGTDEGEDCEPLRYECTFEYPDVPSETELVFVTRGSKWAPLYQYNFFIGNDEIVDGEYERDLRALASDDYTLIPQVAIGGPVTPGNGVVAGEIHDCEDVRLRNAVADIDKDKFIVTYFTSNEEAPLPDTSATGSSILSLYSAMDVDPGPVTVAAAGEVDGQMVSLGVMTVQIFPDAVTSLTFRGLRPFQVP